MSTLATRLLVSLSAALHAALLEEPNAERVRSEPVHELAWKNGCLISFPHGCSRAAWFEDLVGGISKSERSAGGSRDVMERCRGSVHEIGRGTGQYGCWRGDRRVDAVSRSEVVSRKPDRMVSRAQEATRRIFRKEATRRIATTPEEHDPGSKHSHISEQHSSQEMTWTAELKVMFRFRGKGGRFDVSAQI